MKKHLPDLPMRDASTPFKLKLDEETGLPGLNDLFCAVNTKDLEYKYAYYQSVLFKERTLTMTTEDCDTRSKQEIKVKEDGLYVSCDCATQVSRLCSHVVTLFSQMIKDKRFNFFEPLKSFPFTDPKFYDKYLTIGSAYKSILATPKPEFGKIYKYESGVDSEKIKFQRFCNILPAEFEQGEETTAYVMAIHNSFGIPFFMLCSATLNIKRTAIKQFGSFVNPSLDLPTLDLDQKILYGLHRDFDKLINFESINKINRFKEPGRGEMRRTAFNYWKIIVPILKFKKYVFSHRLYARISYKSNHNKKEMFSFSFNDEQVRFQFLFTEHIGYYQLKCKVNLADKEDYIESVFPSENPFFFSLKQAPDVYYQFNTLEEGLLVGELINSGNSFTILKNDLQLFNAEILTDIAINYPVDFQIRRKFNAVFFTIIEKQIKFEHKGDYVWFVPEVVYDNGLTIPVTGNGSKMLNFESEYIRIEYRNKKEEQKFKSLFIKQHPAFKDQYDLDTFYLSKGAFLENDWFEHLTKQFAASGISFIEVENLMKVESDAPEICIDVNEVQDWFDITVSVKFDDITLSPKEILEAVKKQSPTIRLANGEIGHLPETFFKQLSTVFKTGTLTDKGVRVAGQHYTLIDQLYNKLEKPELTQTMAERARLFDEVENMPLITIPNNVKAILRPYQLIGFSWMVHLHSLKWGGLLADDMGLGKTLQVLTLLQHLKNEVVTAPHLLIAPTSLLFNWMEEAAKFCPELKVTVYHGLDREKDAVELKKYDLIITSYGTAAVDIEFLSSIDFQYLILDEAQAIKNPSAQKFKMVQLINAQNKLALTGTPVENSSLDLYALMSFINPGFFGSFRMFKENLISKGNTQDDEGTSTMLKMIKPFILRRTKSQVATDLPPKTEMTIWCEMQPAQRKIYDTYRKRFKNSLTERIDSDGLESSKLYVLDGLMKLRQICNSPVLMKDAPDFEGSSCKIVELMEHIVEKTVGHKILVFSQFTGMLALIKEELEKQGVDYVYLDGKTTLINRKKAVVDFQSNETTRVFLISLKAGGTGLNLTAADYVYLVDPWWNPAVEAQAIDRCYRIGQDKHVMAYRLVCKDTLEEKILKMQEEKKQLANDLIPTDEGVLKSLGKEDLLKLFG